MFSLTLQAQNDGLHILKIGFYALFQHRPLPVQGFIVSAKAASTAVSWLQVKVDAEASTACLFAHRVEPLNPGLLQQLVASLCKAGYVCQALIEMCQLSEIGPVPSSLANQVLKAAASLPGAFNSHSCIA